MLLLPRTVLLATLTLLAGCGLVGQSAVCEQYLDCYDAVLAQNAADADTGTDTGADTGEMASSSYLEGMYGKGGTCWSDPLQRAACDVGCEAGLDVFRGGNDPLPAVCE